jgi:hypothetical protein
MSKQTPEVLRTNLPDHPAVKAWGALQPRHVEPEYLEVVRVQQKSAVYRLAGVGPGRTAVIAKRCPATTARLEQTVYEEILPRVPVQTLHYYGLVEEDEESSWLFLEDGGRERFSPLREEQRRHAAQWLGRLHSAAARIPAATCLPDRGPGHYLQHLRDARQVICQNLDRSDLTGDGRAVLKAVVACCEALEKCWDRVEKACVEGPVTLVHGDFRSKNVLVRAEPGGIVLLPLDWETAGWGFPGPDLVTSRDPLPVPLVDLTVYWSVVRECWSDVDLSALRQFVNVGMLFRRLAALNWECSCFAGGWLPTLVERMRGYQTDIAQAVRAAGWED